MARSTRKTTSLDVSAWLRAAVLGATMQFFQLQARCLVLWLQRQPMATDHLRGLQAQPRLRSMAAGKYVLVHSQADTGSRPNATERAELEVDDKGEHKESTAIYIDRGGLDPSLAETGC